MTFFLQNLVNALQWGSFYALIALGYSMVYGILMLFNFAHGDIFMVGAYIGFGAAAGITALASMGGFALPNWVILVLTIIISMFLTSFVGVLVERVGYRPLREAPRACLMPRRPKKGACMYITSISGNPTLKLLS